MDFKGLSDSQVTESRQSYGSNELSKQETESFLSKLIGGFQDKMIQILLVALVINLVFVFLGKADWYEAVSIAVAICLANFVAVWSEHKNEGTFQSLQDEASRTKSKVYRNGSLVEIMTDDIVVGDLVVLQAGDKIPADGILLKGTIKVDQSTLNGESLEATKTYLGANDVGDTKDLLNKFYVYRGTLVCNGECVMEVKQVGDNSMYGQLAKEMQDEQRDSPLKVKLGDLADKISKFGYIGGGVIALAFIFQSICMTEVGFGLKTTAEMLATVTDLATLGTIVVDAFIIAVVIIVMAVPEGLPMMIALVLAMNMGKMLKSNVLVRKSNGIETAGGVEIIFSDKTGTITYGKLEVVEMCDGSGTTYNKIGDVNCEIFDHMIKGFGVNNSATISKQDGVIGGNSTDRALLEFIAKNNIEVDKSGVVKTLPFDSAKKYATVTIENSDATFVKYVKGAPEKILALCKNYMDADGNIKPIDLDLLNGYMDRQSEKSMRLIAVAMCEAKDVDKEDDEIGNDLTLVCLISIRDNVRPEAVEAIAEVKKAGVQVVMVTGDRKETAVAIAKEAGLLVESTDIALTSAELNEKSDDELKALLPNLRVVARALPMDKSRLVRIAQEMDIVVAMTGDGVNDSPALKKADVGFAMGSGSEVAKEAGDIVILDDNFLSIKQAILYGRTIFKSIRKFIVFQLTVNVSAVSLCFVGPLVGIHEPLTVIQILWVNIIMDTLAALAFGGEPTLKRYLTEKPVKRSESIVSKQMMSGIISSGLFIFLGSLIIMLLGQPYFGGSGNEVYLSTFMFTFFIFAVIFNSFNARTESVKLFEHIGENKRFLTVMTGIAVLQIVMIYLGGVVLRTTPLALSDLLLAIVLGAIVIPFDLVRKAIMNK